jgi:hypothetical protein
MTLCSTKYLNSGFEGAAVFLHSAVSPPTHPQRQGPLDDTCFSEFKFLCVPPGAVEFNWD